jgi:hypothetical protein
MIDCAAEVGAVSEQKKVVPFNESDEEAVIFNTELQSLQDARGEMIVCDAGTRAHIVIRHSEMRQRVRWIIETLRNPLEIRRHPETPWREVYLNVLHASDEDDEGRMVLVIVDTRSRPKRLWNAFTTDDEEYFETMQEGDLLWQP